MLRQYIAGRYINPSLPVVREINRCKHDATTPSGFACHPSTGGELAGTEPTQPPRQASLATPPQEGNCPSTGGNWLVQNPHNHPVKLRLPPLHRRGVSWYRTHTTTPSSFACHPSTGGELPLHRRGVSWYRTHTTTPSSFACHPSTGGELAGTEPTQPPRQASLDTPPQEGS